MDNICLMTIFRHICFIGFFMIAAPLSGILEWGLQLWECWGPRQVVLNWGSAETPYGCFNETLRFLDLVRWESYKGPGNFLASLSHHLWILCSVTENFVRVGGSFLKTHKVQTLEAKMVEFYIIELFIKSNNKISEKTSRVLVILGTLV